MRPTSAPASATDRTAARSAVRTGSLVGSVALATALSCLPGALGASASALAPSTPVGVTSTAAARAGDASRVVLKAPAKAYTRSKVTLRGRVTVRGKARVIRVEARKGGHWKKVTTRRTTKAGKFSVKVSTPPTPATRRYRVTVLRSGALTSASATRTVRIVKAPPAAQTPTPKPADFTTTWQRRTLTLGQASRFTGTGTVPGPTGRHRKVVLQRRHSDGWKTVFRTRTDAAGRFTVHAPADWLVNLEHRVYVPATAKARKRFSQARRLKVSPSWVPRGSAGDWQPLLTPKQAGQKRLQYRWDSCGAPIVYQLNAAEAPSFVTAAKVEEIVDEVAEATGLRFVNGGSTSTHGFPHPGAAWPSTASLVISWSRPSQTSASFSNSQVLGQGGASGYPARDARGAMIAIDRGHVVVRAGSSLLAGDEALTWQVLKHELGHAVGLGHSPSESGRQLMDAYVNPDRDRQWGRGDLAGLRRKGASTGCVKYTGSRAATLTEGEPRDGAPLGPVTAALP